MTPPAARFKQFATTLAGRLRHPTRRGIALTLAALPVLLLLYVLILIPFTPSIGDLRKAKSEKPAVVLSAGGKELAVFQRANRDWVKLADISPTVVAALIATEDRRFYEHHGLDLTRTASAALHTFKGERQGGSTLTQQLARNLYPEQIGRAASLTRKIKEAITALKIEAVYSKDEILESYLNTVPFLYNAYGIEMAARTYFDKSADTLDVLESATLIGMLKGTSYYNPVINPERALQRRNTVLGQMVKYQKLDAAKLEALKKKPLKVDFERQDELLGPAPHFTQQLRRWLIEWADRNDYNIYADGLVVRTTVDSRLQRMANDALTRQANRLQTLATTEWSQRAGWSAKSGTKHDLVQAFVRDSRQYKVAREAGQSEADALKQLLADANFMQTLREDKTRLQAGFMALDPRNGHVMAWVGSRDFAQDQFDHVSQARRQPGSTFKPFVYGAAFANGAKPGDSFVDKALEIPLGNGAFWSPGDGKPPSGATMSLRDGLVFSKNTITAQVMQSVGAERVATLARAMGVRQSRLEEVPSLALGTSPVTLKEMVTAYGTIANDGHYIEPVLVTRIEDRNGKVLEEFEAEPPETAMPVPVAQTLLDVMRGVVDRGTGAGIRSRFGLRADLAGKTGTTQNNTDSWFLLMHPQLVAGAWVGFNDNRVTMGDRWGPGAQSALPIVGEFFTQAFRAKVIDPLTRFAAPRQAGQVDPTLVPGSDALNGGLNGEATPGVNSVEPPLESASGAETGAVQAFGGQPVIRYVTVPGPALEAPPEANVPPSAPVSEAPMRGVVAPAAGEVREIEGVSR
jgi:penicillin-binding protein 1A